MCGGGEAWLGWISMTGPFSSTVLLMGQLQPFNRPIYIEMQGQEGGRAEACAWLKSIPNQRPKRGGPLRGSDTSLFSAALVPSALHKGFKHPTLTAALISTTQLFTFLSHRLSVVCLSAPLRWSLKETFKVQKSVKEITCLTFLSRM